jgi:RND family efflux transporter MFP subunit
MNSNDVAPRSAFGAAARTLVFSGAFVLLAACGGAGEEVPAEVRPVRTLTIENRDSSGNIVLTGRVQSQSEVNQAFRLDGQLIERTVEIGDTVRKGQLLARLDSQNEESGLQSAQAQLVAAQVLLVDARNNFVRMRDLVADAAVSRAAFDNAEAVLKTSEARVQSAQSQVELAQNRLGFTRLYADVGGIVTARGPDAGEVVSAGRMIVQIARVGALDAVFDVPAAVKDVATRDTGVTVFLTSDPNVTAEGRVREVAPRADPVTGTFAVRIELLNAPEAMRLGSTVTGRVQLAAAPAIQVPALALVRTDGGTAVWVVDPETQTVSARPITVQANDSNWVQVQSGLKPGDIIVTAGVQALRPGQKVRLLETPAP